MILRMRWWLSVRLLEAALIVCPWPRIQGELRAVLEAWASTALAQADDNPSAAANIRLSRLWERGGPQVDGGDNGHG